MFAFNSKLFNAIDMLEQVQNYLSQFESYPGENSNDIRSHVVSRGWIEYPRSVYESFCRVSAKTGINSDILGKFEEDSRLN